MTPIRFASLRQEQEWLSGKLDANLVGIVSRWSEYAIEKWGWLWTVTSIWRSREEDRAIEGSGIHTTWRAIDLRTNDAIPGAVADVGNAINDVWTYDPLRHQLKTAIWKPHGTGPHLHLQVHPRTVLKEVAA